MIVKTPSGIEYCEFSVDESLLKIKLIKPGCTVTLDRKVIPDLKNFLDSLEPPGKNSVEQKVSSQKNFLRIKLLNNQFDLVANFFYTARTVSFLQQFSLYSPSIPYPLCQSLSGSVSFPQHSQKYTKKVVFSLYFSTNSCILVLLNENGSDSRPLFGYNTFQEISWIQLVYLSRS